LRWPTVAGAPEGGDVRIRHTSVYVEDQRAALRFYTDVLGFGKKTELPVGKYLWLTVVSPQDQSGPELVLQPATHPAVKPFQEALKDDGIPVTMFTVDNVQAEFSRLRALGVRFAQEPLDVGAATTAVLDDTCGNLIAIAQAH
jgi:catechol 2,3-dioxygenase-like lactoylglutathione lyase family enzyme